MKQLLLLCMLASGMVSARAQTLQPSLRRDIYDFAVGDTFEYAGETYQNMCSVSVSDMIIVLSRQNTATSVSYGVKVNSTSSHPPCNSPGYITSASIYDTLRYGDLDSTIFYYHDSLLYHRDSVLTDVDTIYQDSVMQYRKVNVHIWRFGACCAGDTAYADGLGLVFAGYGSEDYTVSQGGYGMVYYHKANGDVWGTARYFTVGVEDVTEEQPALYPNPSNGSITLRMDDNRRGGVLTMYDISGRMLMRQQIGDDNSTFDLLWADGYYTYTITMADGKSSTSKLVIRR